jgi:hypothetical protein
MKTIVFICAAILAGCAANQTIQREDKYVPPIERKLFDPQIINGNLIMPREQWFHNFKASGIPNFCNVPQAGFLGAYKGKPEDCQITVEKILDFCLVKLSDTYIPEKVEGIARANSYGQYMGMCLLINYQKSTKS